MSVSGLKAELKLLESIFDKDHERFRIVSWKLDELHCQFVLLPLPPPPGASPPPPPPLTIHCNITVRGPLSAGRGARPGPARGLLAAPARHGPARPPLPFVWGPGARCRRTQRASGPGPGPDPLAGRGAARARVSPLPGRRNVRALLPAPRARACAATCLRAARTRKRRTKAAAGTRAAPHRAGSAAGRGLPRVGGEDGRGNFPCSLPAVWRGRSGRLQPERDVFPGAPALGRAGPGCCGGGRLGKCHLPPCRALPPSRQARPLALVELNQGEVAGPSCRPGFQVHLMICFGNAGRSSEGGTGHFLSPRPHWQVWVHEDVNLTVCVWLFLKGDGFQASSG